MISRSGTRQRMVEGATELMRTHGFTGTSFKDVWELTGTPRGSIYFHFPQGKSQLGVEVIRTALERLLLWTEGAEEASASAAEFVRRLADEPVKVLETSRFAQGCPIAAIAIEQPLEFPELREAASDAFAAWRDRIAEAYLRFGVRPEESRDLAAATASALEGAIAISKADGSTRSLRLATDLIVRALPSYQGQRVT